MNRTILILAATASLAVPAAPALSQAPAAARKPVRTLVYLSEADIAPQRLLPAPPPPESAAGKAEIAELHRIIAARSPERLAQAQWDDKHENASAFDATVGPGFDYTRHPATAELMGIVRTDASLTANAAKAFFSRKRPWAVDASIPTCDPDDKPLTSYPSGHAMMGFSTAMTYALVLPGKAQAMMARADDYAFSREVCGAHFASDVHASQALSAAMVATLMKDPRFMAKVEAARAELQAAEVASR
jgi:acid phosphatase (class A)